MGNFHEDMFYSAYLTYLCLKVHSPREEIYSHNHKRNLSGEGRRVLKQYEESVNFGDFSKMTLGFFSMKNLEIVLLNSITHPIHSFPTTMNDIRDHSTTMYKGCFGAFLNHLPTYLCKDFSIHNSEGNCHFLNQFTDRNFWSDLTFKQESSWIYCSASK